MKILIAEDDKFLVRAYEAKFTKAGWDVIITKNGEEALSALKQTPLPDVVLLDLMMPKKDGFSVLFDLKKNTRLKQIPVVVASNLGQKEDIDRAMALGADDFIVKSEMSIEDLEHKVKSHVKA